MQVVHTKVSAEGKVTVAIVAVDSLKRDDLLKLVGEQFYKMTEYKLSSIVGGKVAIMKCPQDKAWSYDVHTFTQVAA